MFISINYSLLYNTYPPPCQGKKRKRQNYMPRSLKCQFRWLGGLTAGRIEFVNRIKESRFCHAKEIKNHCKHQLVTSTAWNDKKINIYLILCYYYLCGARGKNHLQMYQLSFGGNNFSCAFTSSTFASPALPAPFNSNHFPSSKYNPTYRHMHAVKHTTISTVTW